MFISNFNLANIIYYYVSIEAQKKGAEYQKRQIPLQQASLLLQCQLKRLFAVY